MQGPGAKGRDAPVGVTPAGPGATERVDSPGLWTAVTVEWRDIWSDLDRRDYRMEIRFATTVPLREVWEHEQYDFSDWLAENIEFLNEHLPYELDPDSLQSEAAAGAFSVDIIGDVAIDESDAGTAKVILENQLEPTNHDHLGKVLTYLAAYEAKVGIWISGAARPEHTKAIQWLNDHSDADFWLFELEAIRIGESAVAPVLRRIVGPSLLSKRAKAERHGDEEKAARRQAFWEVLIRIGEARMGREHPATSNPRRSGHTWSSVGGISGVGYQYGLKSHAMWVQLRITNQSAALNQWYFDRLYEQRDEIHEDFGGSLEWRSEEGVLACTVQHSIPGGGLEDEDRWDAIAENAVDAMERLYRSTRNRVLALQPPDELNG